MHARCGVRVCNSLSALLFPCQQPPPYGRLSVRVHASFTCSQQRMLVGRGDGVMFLGSRRVWRAASRMEHVECAVWSRRELDHSK